MGTSIELLTEDDRLKLFVVLYWDLLDVWDSSWFSALISLNCSSLFLNYVSWIYCFLLVMNSSLSSLVLILLVSFSLSNVSFFFLDLYSLCLIFSSYMVIVWMFWASTILILFCLYWCLRICDSTFSTWEWMCWSIFWSIYYGLGMIWLAENFFESRDFILSGSIRRYYAFPWVGVIGLEIREFCIGQ